MDSIAPSSVAELEDVVRAAIADRQPIEPVGGGTQLDVGYPPVRPLREVSLSSMRAIVEYSPQDLVVVAEAGMTVAGLQDVLSEHGQTLPIEVANPERQTLAGVVASRANSLSRSSNGSVRDWLIGCRVVGGEGVRLSAGGKVVKNVAGYDLPKLYCGSWGTLGVLYEVAFKIAPVVESSSVILVSLNSERNSEEALDILHSKVEPAFTYLLNADAARVVLGDDAPQAQFLVIGFDGQSEAVAALVGRAKDALFEDAYQIIDLTADVACRLRNLLRDLSQRSAPLTVRCNILPSQVGAFARMLEWTSRRAGFSATVFADAAVGIVQAHIYPRDPEPADGEPNRRWIKLYPDLRDKIDRVGGSAVFERMPSSWREADYPVWSPVLEDIAWMRALKARLDPHGVFRPGRYVGRI
jgi:glycolate oxidase FAD binding subunit